MIDRLREGRKRLLVEGDESHILDRAGDDGGKAIDRTPLVRVMRVFSVRWYVDAQAADP